MSTRKIGWQKYEDIIESHVNSPILDTILGKFTDISGEHRKNIMKNGEELVDQGMTMIPLSSKMLDIAMLNNFECWMGHANFDITPDIKDKLNKIER